MHPIQWKGKGRKRKGKRERRTYLNSSEVHERETTFMREERRKARINMQA